MEAHQAPLSLGFSRQEHWSGLPFPSPMQCKVKGKSLSRVRLLATPWTAAFQAPPSMGFSRQEYWSGVPLPSPMTNLDSIKKQRHYFGNKGPYNQRFSFSTSHVWMWELDHKEDWALKNWSFWIVVLEKTLLYLRVSCTSKRSLECNLINAKKMEEMELCESPERVSQLKGVYGIGENYSHEELDTTERLHFHFSLSCIGEGNGNPLQCSCLENPKDRGA